MMEISDSEADRLREALRPFAEASVSYPDSMSSSLIVVDGFSPFGLLVGDFRRARTAYDVGDRTAMVRALEYFAAMDRECRFRQDDALLTYRSGTYWTLPKEAPSPGILVRHIRHASRVLAASSREGRTTLFPADHAASRKQKEPRQMNEPQWIEKLAMLPSDARGRIRRYIEEGYGASMSTFYRCLIANDLIGAIQGGDAENRAALPDYVEYLTAYAPEGCYGSLEKLNSWRGLSHAEP